MKEQTIFPREEHADVLFQKILADPWACDKLFETFCNDLFSKSICSDLEIIADCDKFLVINVFAKDIIFSVFV